MCVRCFFVIPQHPMYIVYTTVHIWKNKHNEHSLHRVFVVVFALCIFYFPPFKRFLNRHFVSFYLTYVHFISWLLLTTNICDMCPFLLAKGVSKNVFSFRFLSVYVYSWRRTWCWLVFPGAGCFALILSQSLSFLYITEHNDTERNAMLVAQKSSFLKILLLPESCIQAP